MSVCVHFMGVNTLCCTLPSYVFKASTFITNCCDKADGNYMCEIQCLQHYSYLDNYHSIVTAETKWKKNLFTKRSNKHLVMPCGVPCLIATCFSGRCDCLPVCQKKKKKV